MDQGEKTHLLERARVSAPPRRALVQRLVSFKIYALSVLTFVGSDTERKTWRHKSFRQAHFVRSPAQRLSQQKTHQASFLGNHSQDNPVDVEVPEDAFDATNQPSLSRPQVPQVLAVLILPCVLWLVMLQAMVSGPSASLEVFLRELAVRQTEQFKILTNQIADIQRQLRELPDVTTRRSGCASQQARSVDIVRSHFGSNPFWLKTFLSTMSAVTLLFDQELG